MPDNVPNPNSVANQDQSNQDQSNQDQSNQDQKERALHEILRRMEQELRKEFSIGGQTLDQIEEQSQKIGEEVKRIIEEESFQVGGTGYSGAFLPCPRGHSARYAGLRSRLLITRSGIRTLRRAYYSCAACHHGWCPLDKTLGLGKGQCSRQVQALIARFSSYLPDRVAAQE